MGHNQEKLVRADQSRCSGEDRVEIHRHVFEDGAWTLPDLRRKGEILWCGCCASSEKTQKRKGGKDGGCTGGRVRTILGRLWDDICGGALSKHFHVLQGGYDPHCSRC